MNSSDGRDGGQGLLGFTNDEQGDGCHQHRCRRVGRASAAGQRSRRGPARDREQRRRPVVAELAMPCDAEQVAGSLAVGGSDGADAPSANHRMLFRKRDKEYIVLVANRLAIAGLASMALSMCGGDPADQRSGVRHARPRRHRRGFGARLRLAVVRATDASAASPRRRAGPKDGSLGLTPGGPRCCKRRLRWSKGRGRQP